MLSKALKLTITLFSILPIITLAQTKLNYKVYYSDQLEKEGLKVFIQIQSIKALDSNYFYFSNKVFGENNITNCLTNFIGENDKYLFKIIPDSNRIIVYHPTSKNVSFYYHVKQDYLGDSTNIFYRPRIKNNYFHVLGQSLFMVPELIFKSEDENPEIETFIEWINFPDNFVIHNTFGTHQKRQTSKSKLWGEFYYSLFVGGDYRVYPIPYETKTIYFALRGEWQIYNETELLTSLKKTVLTQRDFWKDKDFNYYTIVMSPTMTQTDSSYKRQSIRGASLYNGFMIQSSNNPFNDWDLIKYMFNHEMMHEWIGGQIKMKNEYLNKWFSEGFTDYYAYKNKLRNGDLSFEEWLTDFNKYVFEAHFNNPVKNQPNYLLNDKYWKDPNYKLIPYRRGAIFAFWVDNQILKKSNFTKSLDDLMRDILQKCTIGKRKFSDELFLEEVQNYLNEDITYFFQKYVITGIDFNFTTVDLIEGFVLEYNETMPLLKINNTTENIKNKYLNVK